MGGLIIVKAFIVLHYVNHAMNPVQLNLSDCH